MQVMGSHASSMKRGGASSLINPALKLYCSHYVDDGFDRPISSMVAPGYTQIFFFSLQSLFTFSMEKRSSSAPPFSCDKDKKRYCQSDRLTAFACVLW